MQMKTRVAITQFIQRYNSEVTIVIVTTILILIGYGIYTLTPSNTSTQDTYVNSTIHKLKRDLEIMIELKEKQIKILGG